MDLVIVVSGPIAVGKSAFLGVLEREFGAVRISTRALLLDRGVADDRDALQKAGEQLDRDTGGSWVAEDVKRQVQQRGGPRIVLVDCARTLDQLAHLRRVFGLRIYHVHLTASDPVLEGRYLLRPASIREFASYAEVRANSATEAGIESLAPEADVCINTDFSKPDGTVVRALAGTGLYAPAPERLVDVLVGGQYGSEGKGNICAHLARDYDVLVRVGGPNAGHKVADPEFIYVQMPSGTLSNPQAKILIGAGATIWLPQVLDEIDKLGLTPDRLSIDEQAMIIEQSDRDLETKTFDAIGSTKQGVGAATARKILGRDRTAPLGAAVRLVRDVPELRTFCRDTKLELERAYTAGRKILLEGTQGTDLSLHHGIYGYVTSRETTAAGCLADAGIAPLRVRKVIMVTRTYPIRVGGTSGEFPGGEIDFERVAARSGLPLAEIVETEVGTISHNPRRVGEFDWDRVRRAAVLNGATDVALTFADYIDAANKNARRFDQLTPATQTFIANLERVTKATVSIVSVGPGRRTVLDRRNWR